jgi:hypothetical protein
MPSGIAVVVFFVVYQQLENHLLQPWIFSRTVKLNPLAVLVAILLAVELAGILGALLAIPIAGIIQVVWDNRHGRPKQRPTIGADRAPINAGSGTEPAPGPHTDPGARPGQSPSPRSPTGITPTRDHGTVE